MDDDATDAGRVDRVTEPARVDELKGELITQAFDYDAGRQATVYRPPARPQAVIFAGDGQLISGWGPYLEAADLPPTMIVGVHRTDAQDEMVRLREYSTGLDPKQFAAHERFFVQIVGEWVRSRFGVTLPTGRSVVGGASASAELSLAMGLRHPNVFGAVFAASPGAGYRPPSIMPTGLPRIYLTAGTREPFFLNNATRWAKALRAAGADIVMSKQLGDHGGPFWKAEFVKMVQWVFRS